MIGVSMTTDYLKYPSCVKFTGSPGNGGTEIVQLNCPENNNANIGRYFFMQRLPNASYRRFFSLCEIILDAYEIIGNCL